MFVEGGGCRLPVAGCPLRPGAAPSPGPLGSGRLGEPRRMHLATVTLRPVLEVVHDSIDATLAAALLVAGACSVSRPSRAVAPFEVARSTIADTTTDRYARRKGRRRGRTTGRLCDGDGYGDGPRLGDHE